MIWIGRRDRYGRRPLATLAGAALAGMSLGISVAATTPPVPPDLARAITAATGGNVDAQVKLGEAYATGKGAPLDPKEARRWYGMAAAQNHPMAARRLGELYAKGQGGRKDKKKAMEFWRKAEKGGDPFVAILVADEMFSQITGGKTPGPGTYGFRGGVPVADIDTNESWYRAALESDPRPEVRQRAQHALTVLATFKTAAKAGK